jgi:imidazolonepropionase-like amidohydrolase
VKILQLNGGFFTPGLIDMHPHHIAMTWPYLPSTDDANKTSDSTGPFPPMMRILDSLKAYDQATAIISPGGVTSS